MFSDPGTDNKSSSSTTPHSATPPSPEQDTKEQNIPTTDEFYNPHNIKRGSTPHSVLAVLENYKTRPYSRFGDHPDEKDSKESSPSGEASPTVPHTRQPSPRHMPDRPFSTLGTLPEETGGAPVQAFTRQLVAKKVMVVSPGLKPKPITTTALREIDLNQQENSINVTPVNTPHPDGETGSATSFVDVAIHSPAAGLPLPNDMGQIQKKIPATKRIVPSLSRRSSMMENGDNCVRFIYRLGYNATAKPLQDFKKFHKDHYVAFWTGLITAIFANGINALMGPSNQQPEKIGSDWWNNMSPEARLDSIESLVASLIVNGYINSNMLALLPQTVKKFKEDRFKIITGLGITAFSLTAAGAITYEAVEPWATSYGAPFLVIPSVISVFVTRFFGGASLAADKLERLRINTARGDQAKLIEDIIDLDSSFKKHMETFIANSNFQDGLTEKNASVIFDEIYKYTVRNQIRLNRSRWLTGFNYLQTGLKTAFALYMANIVLPSFTQKGFEGARIMHITPDNTCTDSVCLEGASIGFLPGLASAIFYYMTCSDTFSMLKNTYRYLKKYPDQILYCALWAYTNYKASMSMFNVGQGVMNKPNGLFSFLRESMPWMLSLFYGNFAFKNGLAGGIVNSTLTFRGEFLDKSSKFDFEDFIRYCENKYIPVNKVESKDETPSNSVVRETLDTLFREDQDSVSSPQRKEPWCSLFSCCNRQTIGNATLKQPLLSQKDRQDEPLDVKDHDDQPQNFNEVPSVRSLS